MGLSLGGCAGRNQHNQPGREMLARASIVVDSGAKTLWPEMICSIREHNTGHCFRGKEEILPD